MTDERGGVTVVVDGLPQSHVDPADPGLLTFEYIQHFALVLDVLPPGPLAVTHVGGAGMTLARYVQHSRPGSPQIVLEPDVPLTEAVRRELPLPRGHRIRVRPLDGVPGVSALAPASADVVVVDAYDAGQVPAALSSSTFLAQCARVLRPAGVLLLNLADEPGLRYVARVAATARPLLPHLLLLATQEVAKGKRFGNTVLVASRTPLPEPALHRKVAGASFPTALFGPARLARLIGSVAPFGVDGGASPPPPDPDSWRLC